MNNGGRTQRGEAINTSLEVDKALLDLNTIGTISVTKAVLPQMVKQNKGLIVVVSSISGKLGENNNCIMCGVCVCVCVCACST